MIHRFYYVVEVSAPNEKLLYFIKSAFTLFVKSFKTYHPKCRSAIRAASDTMFNTDAAKAAGSNIVRRAASELKDPKLRSH